MKHDKSSRKVHHQNFKEILYFINVLTATGLSSYLSQIIVGYPMLWLLGSSTFQTPLVTAIRTALSYFVAIFALVTLPKFLTRKKSSKDAKCSISPDSTVLSSQKSSSNNSISSSEYPTWLTSKEELGIISLPTFTDIFLSIIGFFIYLLLSSLFLQFFNSFPWFQANEAQDVGFSRYLSEPDRIFAFIALVILAPIFEELIFRGWLYGKLRKSSIGTINPKKAGQTTISIPLAPILLTSILFGFLHGQWNVGVNVFALSLVLCCLREITGTIYASILLHIIKNGIAFYLMYIIGFF